MEHETKMTFQNEYGTYSVSLHDSEIMMSEVYEQLFVPLMVSVGYPYEIIIKYLDNLDILEDKKDKPYIGVGVKEVDLVIANYLEGLHDNCPLTVQNGTRNVQDWLIEEADRLRSTHGLGF